MNLNAIRAITFDAAQTLFHPKPSVGSIYGEVMREHGLDYPPEALQSGFKRAFGSVEKDLSISDGELREWRYWEAVVRESVREFDAQPDDFDALFHDLWRAFAQGDRWRVDSDAPAVLKELRGRGYSINLLTNWDRRVRQVVDESALAGKFDHLFISSEIGADKPDRAIFAHVEATMGLAPNQLLHVGDSFENDVEGALAAGWQAFHLIEESPSPTDHPVLRSLSALLEALPNQTG